jgi:alpha(1,3/1,4) fucosyltransferase
MTTPITIGPTLRRRQVLLEFPGLGDGRLFSQEARDNVLEPFIYLRSRLRGLGYALTTADDHPVVGAHAVWFWDVPAPPRSRQMWIRRRSAPRDLLGECLRAGMHDRLAVFLGEPAVVLPRNDDPRRWRDFGTIFTWRDDLAAARGFVKYLLPVPATFPTVPDPPFAMRRLLVNISSNKRSSHPGELYTVRRATIRYCECFIPHDFALYGLGWDAPGESFPSYRGSPHHKWDVLPQFRFALAYENMAAPGYVTEKIIDAIRAGAVPVYLGAPNVEEYVDAEAFIDRRQIGSDEELVRFLRDVDEATYLRYRAAAKEYLMSARFERFLPRSFADTVIAHAGL